MNSVTLKIIPRGSSKIAYPITNNFQFDKETAYRIKLNSLHIHKKYSKKLKYYDYIAVYLQASCPFIFLEEKQGKQGKKIIAKYNLNKEGTIEKTQEQNFAVKEPTFTNISKILCSDHSSSENHNHNHNHSLMLFVTLENKDEKIEQVILNEYDVNLSISKVETYENCIIL